MRDLLQGADLHEGYADEGYVGIVELVDVWGMWALLFNNAGAGWWELMCSDA